MPLSATLQTKLDDLSERHEEIAALLADAETVADRDRYTALSKEYAELEPVIATFNTVRGVEGELADCQLLLTDDDPDLREMAQDDVDQLQKRLSEAQAHLQMLLLPKDPNDAANVFLEVRAGTGGDEAAIFAGDLHRMYTRYAESKGWSVEIINARAGEHGGYKEVVSRIAGRDVFSRLKFESGAHRVQRVPETESQGRIHTSACTVAILPEPDEIEDIEISRKDIREDTFRASGAGGQHVNKTDSAIRLTHLPSGIVVECQDERSQHKNRARAMSLLKAKLLEIAESTQRAEEAENRRNLVGSGDRSERIRTYNFPQGRITDHRINLTLYKLDEILAGDADSVIEPLIQEHQTDLLASLGETT